MKELNQVQQIIETFKKVNPAPVYFIGGEEEFFHDSIIKNAENYLVDKAFYSLNCDHIYLSEQPAETILPICKNLPMMSNQRLVIVHDAELLGKYEPDDFLKYLDKPEPFTCVIFSAKSADMRKKIFAQLKTKAVFIDAKPIKNESELFLFIKHEFENKNKKIEDIAAQVLLEHVGDNLFELKNQIEKIVIYGHDKEIITVQDIEDMTGIMREYSVFEMIKSLVVRDAEKGLKILKLILEQGDDPIAINAAIYSRFIKQWQVAQLLEEKQTDKAIAEKVGVAPFFIREYIMAARYYSKRQVANVIDILCKTDYKLKSTNNPIQTVEMSIIEILAV
jgi:DNA polymerase-3 subunit delta